MVGIFKEYDNYVVNEYKNGRKVADDFTIKKFVEMKNRIKENIAIEKKDKNEKTTVNTKKVWYQNNKETISKQKKVYGEENREKLRAYAKEYDKKNREKISLRKGKKITCEFCGNIYRIDTLKKHQKTAKCSKDTVIKLSKVGLVDFN